MDDFDRHLNKIYLSAIRQRKKSGARWQKVTEVSSAKARPTEYDDDRAHARGGSLGEYAPGTSIPTMMRNQEIAEEVKGRVHTLLGLAKQILTERQYAVFVLMAVKEPNMTEREIAKVLSISPGRVHQLNTAAMKKLRRAYDERT
jgi:RNA polymerase sigma factor (sigma-70 family)